jgi:nucleoside-diphosphate-sugar epimerase
MVLKTVAVTGALGMLGQHIMSELLLAGFNVVSVSRSSKNNESHGSWDLLHWKSDEEFDRLLSSVDVVIHAGAAVPGVHKPYSDDELFYTNVGASLNIARWCRKRSIPFIYISGAIVYDDPHNKGIKEDSKKGFNDFGGFYGQSKLFAEDLLNREKDAGLSLSIVRPSSIYGYGLSAEKLVCIFLDKASNGHTIEIERPIEDCINFIHAADVSNAIVKIIQKKEWDTFNISSGKCVSIIDLAKTCISVVGNGKVIVSQKHQTREFLARYALNNKLSIKKLGWHPQVNLFRGVRSIFEKKVIHAEDISSNH